MILVVGSTGLVGGSVVRRLVANGKPTTAMVRDADAEKARALHAIGAKLVVGDLKDGASVERALDGAETVICTASATLSRREGDSLEAVDGAGVQTLIGLADRKRARRFIFVSISRNIANDFPLAEYKRAAERRLEATKLAYTILQPACFTEVWLSPAVGFDVAGGTVRVYGDGHSRISYISLEDVATAVVACVENPATSGRAIPIGGPQAYSQLEAIELVERATGKTLVREHMTSEQIKAARAGAADPMGATFLGLFDAVSRGDEIPPASTHALGVRAVSLHEWVGRTFGSR